MRRIRHYIHQADEPTHCYHCHKPLGSHRWEVYIENKRKACCSEIHAHEAYDEKQTNLRRLAKELGLV